MQFFRTLVGGVPESAAPNWGVRIKLSAERALRTFLQAVAGALAAGGVGSAAMSLSYWEGFGVAVIGAAVAALASFLLNVSTFLPEDPGQNPNPPS